MGGGTDIKTSWKEPAKGNSILFISSIVYRNGMRWWWGGGRTNDGRRGSEVQRRYIIFFFFCCFLSSSCHTRSASKRHTVALSICFFPSLFACRNSLVSLSLVALTLYRFITIYGWIIWIIIFFLNNGWVRTMLRAEELREWPSNDKQRELSIVFVFSFLKLHGKTFCLVVRDRP